MVQTISYLPHFLSWIIVTGILHDMLSGTGIVNEVLVNLHIIKQPINFFAHTSYFWPIVAFCKCVEGNRLECHYLSGSNHSN